MCELHVFTIRTSTRSPSGDMALATPRMMMPMLLACFLVRAIAKRDVETSKKRDVEQLDIEDKLNEQKLDEHELDETIYSQCNVRMMFSSQETLNCHQTT